MWRPTARLIGALAVAGVPLLLLSEGAEALGVVLLLAGPLLTLAGVEGVALWLFSQRLEARRQLSFRLSMGEPNPVHIELRSRAPISLLGEATDDLPEGFLPGDVRMPVSLSPHDRVTLRYVTEPPARGNHAFRSIWLRLRSLVGLVEIQLEVPAPSEVPVYPNLRALQRFRLMARHRIGLAGLHRVRGAARGGEFERLRDYSRDDRYRDIDWKATARRDRPVIRVTRPERGQQVLLAIDTGRGMAPRIGRQTRLDVALSAALLLADVALSQEDRVGLCLFSHQVHRYLKPGRDPGALPRFLGQLYDARATYSGTSYLDWARWLAPRLKRRTLIVLWTDLTTDDSGLGEALSVLHPRHLPLVVALRDHGLEGMAQAAPATNRDAYHRAVATELLGARDRLARQLRLRGARVLEASDESMSLEVIERYLALKLRGGL